MGRKRKASNDPPRKVVANKKVKLPNEEHTTIKMKLAPFVKTSPILNEQSLTTQF